MSSLELIGLTKKYGAQSVLDGIDLSIEHGQLVCLLGPSGCGKTTTLRMVAGFNDPSAGEIRLGDRVISAPGKVIPPERRNMSMIFQSYALWPHMTIAENVAYGLKLRRMPSSQVKEKVRTMLDIVHMQEFSDRYPSELSGGQQQRVALARAIVVEPQTLLLDEPLSNLDANLREEMRFEIRRLHDQFKFTTLYVTHDQSEAMAAADLIVVMNKGGIEQIGSPRDIYEFPKSVFVARFIGGNNVITGRPVSSDRLSLNGADLFCNDFAKLDPRDATGAISIRTEHASILKEPGPRKENTARGRVRRKVYAGGRHDYCVALDCGQDVRILAPLSCDAKMDEVVWVFFPREHCLAVKN